MVSCTVFLFCLVGGPLISSPLWCMAFGPLMWRHDKPEIKCIYETNGRALNRGILTYLVRGEKYREVLFPPILDGRVDNTRGASRAWRPKVSDVESSSPSLFYEFASGTRSDHDDHLSLIKGQEEENLLFLFEMICENPSSKEEGRKCEGPSRKFLRKARSLNIFSDKS